ncbi:MAG: hypothetical protein QG575_1821 [Euryarchaeota archaeon]|nr:hypothetical protein [Euryarchaeota archaeon]
MKKEKTRLVSRAAIIRALVIAARRTARKREGQT